MGPRIRVNLAAGTALNVVVADGLRRLQCLLQLLVRNRLKRRVLAPGGVVRPNTRVAVRLQLQSNSSGILARVLIVAQPERALQVLDVVAILVRGGVLLCQRAVGAAEPAEVVEEAHVEVRGGVARAVERAGVGACKAASGVHVVFEDGHVRLGELGVGLCRQDLLPDGVQGTPRCCCAAVVILVRGTRFLAVFQRVVALGLRLGLGAVSATQHPVERAAEVQQRQQHHNHSSAAATAE